MLTAIIIGRLHFSVLPIEIVCIQQIKSTPGFARRAMEVFSLSQTWIPQSYTPRLDVFELQMAISLIKRNFQDNLANLLNLKRISAPLFVEAGSGLNDDLNGYERPVSFDIAHTDTVAQVVHSLAKWKRLALYRYGFHENKGLYTDMNAIRRDEEMDNLHSVYVDQWDWEKVITREQRNLDYLKETVVKIVNAICYTLDIVKSRYPKIDVILNRNITFITAQELEDRYPDLTPKQRENQVAKEYGTVFLMQIGGVMKSGQRHDGRAPDYDDWSLNGDLLFWDETLECALEVSSMGIRVDSEALDRQLRLSGCDNRRQLPYHQMLLRGELPLTIGGGIGQSRLCMLLLGCAHIGEVQVSIWDADTQRICKEAGVLLL